MHAIAFAIPPDFAALARFHLVHPCAVTVLSESVFPNIPESVFVDVALVILASDAGAGGDAAVDEDGGNAQAGGALVEVVAYLRLVFAEKTFARVADVASCIAFVADEVEHLTKLFVGEQEFGVLCGSSHGVDAEHAPVLYSPGPQHLAYLGQFGAVMLVHACHYVPYERPRQGFGSIVLQFVGFLSGKAYGPARCRRKRRSWMPGPLGAMRGNALLSGLRRW